MKKLILLFLLLPVALMAQRVLSPDTKKADHYMLRQPTRAVADTTFTINATGNDTSAVYPVWPHMTAFLETTSSGTVEYSYIMQVRARRDSEINNGSPTNWVQESSTAVTATGASRIVLTSSAIANYPAECRYIFDGTGSNDASTVAQVVTVLSNPYL